MADKKEHNKEHYFSKAVRAGRRTYFFDVKSTKKGDYYLTITESKRRFDNEQGKFFYEKFKVFLYREDFDKFSHALEESLNFINSQNGDFTKDNSYQLDNGKDDYIAEAIADDADFNTQSHADVDFEDLGPLEEDDQKSSATD